MTSTLTSAEARMRARMRPRAGNVVAFPGVMLHYTYRGDEYRWRCPLRGCNRSGKFVKRFATALRGLDRHVQACHR